MESIFNFFISTAYADAGTGAANPQGGMLSLIVMFGVFFIFVYFTVWRPQAKRAREQQQLISSLTKGDEVVTAGGILGQIAKVTDQYVVLTLSAQQELILQKSAIVSVLPKGTLKSLA